jgi:hypothetical protein
MGSTASGAPDTGDTIVSVVGALGRETAAARFRTAFAMMSPRRRESLVAHRMRSRGLADPVDAMLELLEDLRHGR